MNTSQVSHSENLQPFCLFVCFGFQININIYIYIGTNIGMHHCNSLVQSMAFTSLNTIDKNCVAVTSRGRKTSGSWGLWFLHRNPEPRRDDRRPSPRSECNAEWCHLGSSCLWMLPVGTCTPRFSTFGYECWGFHLHLGENCVLCFLVSCSEVH